LKLKKNHLNRFVLFAKTEDFQSCSSFFPTPNILTKKNSQKNLFKIVSSLDRMYHSTVPVRYDTKHYFVKMTKQSLKKMAFWKGIKKIICVCISLSLMSFVTPQPSQSEKTFEFSRLKLETKATPTKAACKPRPLP